MFRSLGGFASYDRRDSRNVVAVARIRPDASLARLQAELDAFSRRMAERYPQQNRELAFRADSFRELYSGGVRPYLWVLLGAAALLLLMACLNAANLLLARALARQQELAVRLALGAGPREILGGYLAEAVFLAALASTGGAMLSAWWVSAFRTLIGGRLPSWMNVDFDFQALAFGVTIALRAAIASVLAPALHSLGRNDLASRLRESGRGSAGGRGTGRLRDMLTGAQVALAVVLLAGAGLLVRGFVALENRDKGFDATRVSTFLVALGWKRYIKRRSRRRLLRAGAKETRHRAGDFPSGLRSRAAAIGTRGLAEHDDPRGGATE